MLLDLSYCVKALALRSLVVCGPFASFQLKPTHAKVSFHEIHEEWTTLLTLWITRYFNNNGRQNKHHRIGRVKLNRCLIYLGQYCDVIFILKYFFLKYSGFMIFYLDKPFYRITVRKDYYWQHQPYSMHTITHTVLNSY